MKRLSFIIVVCFWAVQLFAQSTYTEELTREEAGKGTVVIRQSEEIDRAVNRPRTAKPVAPVVRRDTVSHTHEESMKGKTEAKKPRTKENYVARGRHKSQGFRICIFTGGNSRQDKNKAVEMGNKCRRNFPELAVYTTFSAPRWVTNVGDFKTRNEAQKYVGLIRSARFTYEVRIVASEVNLPD